MNDLRDVHTTPLDTSELPIVSSTTDWLGRMKFLACTTLKRFAGPYSDSLTRATKTEIFVCLLNACEPLAVQPMIAESKKLVEELDAFGIDTLSLFLLNAAIVERA